MGRPRLFVCRGGDCRREREARDALLDVAAPLARVVEVRCQKICDGPVCGLEVDGELVWFAEVSTGKARDALAALLRGEPMRGSLRKRRVGKRRGRLRE